MNENTLGNWHKYVLNYWQIENKILLGSVSTQPPPRQDVKKSSLKKKPRRRRRWAIQRGMPERQEGTNWGRKPPRTARDLRRFLSSLCSTSLISTSTCQHWVDRFLRYLFFNISHINTLHCFGCSGDWWPSWGWCALQPRGPFGLGREEVFAIFDHL